MCIHLGVTLWISRAPEPSKILADRSKYIVRMSNDSMDRKAGIKASSPLASSSQLLDYERQMTEDLISEDALCITSSGMGWQKVGM